MRQLGHGQSVMFFAPAEVHARIKSALESQDIASDSAIHTADILRWAMGETCADIQHHLPHWAHQGLEYTRRASAYRQFLTSGDLGVLREHWITPESRSLEGMYGSKRDSESLNKQAYAVEALGQRLGLLSAPSLDDPTMEEEQEREVSHEAEKERYVERPAKEEPREHRIHADLQHFVNTGTLRPNSAAFEKPFSALFGLDSSLWTSSLLTTKDFLWCIKSPTSTARISSHLRPVHWLLSSTHSGKAYIYIIVSPYEANALIPWIREDSNVRLHMYNARVTQSMRSFSKLDFYTAPCPPSTSWKPPTEAVQLQLDLWSGTLYLDSYSAYVSLCLFLGVYSEESKDLYGLEHPVKRSGDGFVLPVHRGAGYRHLHILDDYGGRSFQESPIAALKNLFGLRRHGMTFLQTHMGQLLHGRPLTRSDFKQK
jgi:hypothetical protein